MGLAPGDTALPAIVVIHEWWGLNDNIKAMTRRLAGEGFRALAVDLYKGEVAQQPDQAQALVELAMENRPQLVANLEAAYTYLTDTYGAPAVGVIGWCFGGGMALNAALAMPTELDAAVIYYGHIYESAGHAFANPSGQDYVAEAAEDAWNKTTAFLKEQLYGQGAGT